jgi:hypothetical protein
LSIQYVTTGSMRGRCLIYYRTAKFGRQRVHRTNNLKLVVIQGFASVKNLIVFMGRCIITDLKSFVMGPRLYICKYIPPHKNKLNFYPHPVLHDNEFQLVCYGDPVYLPIKTS